MKVWPSPDVMEFMGAKDALTRIAHLNIGLEDTLTYFEEDTSFRKFGSNATFCKLSVWSDAKFGIPSGKAWKKHPENPNEKNVQTSDAQAEVRKSCIGSRSQRNVAKFPFSSFSFSSFFLFLRQNGPASAAPFQ